MTKQQAKALRRRIVAYTTALETAAYTRIMQLPEAKDACHWRNIAHRSMNDFINSLIDDEVKS